ncbi:MFS transporter [Gymnodinialimonas ceratoperidinii]|uniref:MFS transporter n=1 Tax=Gymnodinialimonas ceratoperidinii TaxID=2856823 RepID=A0A8F6TYH6_9RHOB|nr:MFS transporter [Gymnodinialimonas ceratoperidinii]QXT41247.1 MFS transporter [Gymnodinialimonas ceratoperidinii]
MLIAGGAFKDRQFRLFFGGVFFAVQAIWIQRVTLGWLAWERTGQASAVGLVAALSLFPTLLFGPFFGVMADRVDIRKAALVTNGLMAAIIAVLALLASEVGAVGLSLAALSIGLISAAHHPVRMSLGPRLVSAEMVQHVVSITALNFNLARLVAPVLAGWVIATAGGATALWLAALCYVPMLAVLPALHPRSLPPRAAAPILSDLVEGVRYAAADPLIWQALLMTMIFATSARGALEVLPVVADGGFGRGAAGLGFLTAAAGVGALTSALLKAGGVSAVGARISRTVWVASFAGQGAVIAMGLAPSWPLVLLAVALTGLSSTWCGVSLQSAIQTGLPDAFRGRVMSFWVVVGFGTVSLGSVAIGAAADLIGIGPALAVAGTLGTLGMVIVGVRARTNPPM